MYRFMLVALAAVMIALVANANSVIIQDGPRQDLLVEAIDAYYEHADQIENSDHIVIVDYALHSSQERLYFIDMKTGETTRYKVAHGRGSDRNHDGFLDRFSNKSGSNASSRGAYITAEEYYGKHGRSLRLDGLDATNSAARARAIVVHSAAYAEPEILAAQGKLGRSLGCIVFSEQDRDAFFDNLPEGTLLYVNN